MRGFRALSLIVLLCGCETTRPHRTFVFGAPELEETFQQYYESTSPDSRAAIDALRRDSRVRIHLIRGQLDPDLSRGGASAPHDSTLGRQSCILHPATEDGAIEADFDWDVVLDEPLQKRMAGKLGLETPVGALLEHEILGHFLHCYTGKLCRPPSRDRARWQAERENEAIAQENKYRAYRHVPLVDWTVTPEGERVKTPKPRAP